MAAELHPPGEAPIITPISSAAADSAAAVSASADATAVPTTSAAAPTTTSDLLLATLSDHNTGPPPTAPKRQRRPSVRLGEIGDQPVTLSYDAHHQHHPLIRRAKHQSWRPNKELASSKSVKARSLTNLVTGNDGREAQEVETNQNGDVGFEFGQRRKAKRGTTKRLRSSWVSKVEDVGVGGEEKLIRQDKEEEEEEGFREFNPDSDSQLKVQESPLRSFDINNAAAIDTWGRRGGAESGAGRGGEGVRSWLIDLGLSRYSPVFEVHEVDDEVLPFLTLEDLKDMGINAVGSRRKLFSAIQKLRQGYS